jgi:hypothetical protein
MFKTFYVIKCFFYKCFFKCNKLNLKIILINNFFEIIFFKTFLCSKIKFKVPKKSQKIFFTLNFFS